jgi:ubiquinone/menaquinone biosynthesis C-methylase UbiE
MVTYDCSKKEWKYILENEEARAASEQWYRTDTVDYWRHARMRSVVDPFIGHSSGKHCWLTVGDGRYGTDAHWLLSRGEAVHASDVDDTLLKEGAAIGFINEFSAQNAEALSFPDAAFDYVFCKEAFHHFPRPWMGVYEMMRVARRAVILIEPNDVYSLGAHHVSLKSHFKRNLLRWIGRALDPDTTNWHYHEPVGNYLYRLSAWECEKLQMGLHNRWIGFRGVNDRYTAGIESCPMTGGNSEQVALRGSIMDGIANADRAARCLDDFNIISVALFVAEPELALKRALRAQGWLVKELPANPHR